MTIYLRAETDSQGDTVDLYWYCSYPCYVDSIQAALPIEEGGAYPCGAESDSPDYCATCGEPIGNPLTSEGESYVRELVAEVASELFPASLYSLPTKFAKATNTSDRIEQARMLFSEYSYLFETDNV